MATAVWRIVAVMAIGVFPCPRRKATDDKRLATRPLVLLLQQHQQRFAVDAARLAWIVENDFVAPHAEIEEKRAVADVEIMVRQRRIGEHTALPWIRKPIHINVILVFFDKQLPYHISCPSRKSMMF